MTDILSALWKLIVSVHKEAPGLIFSCILVSYFVYYIYTRSYSYGEQLEDIKNELKKLNAKKEQENKK